MPRTCTICHNAHRDAIEQALRNGRSIRAVSLQFGVTHGSLHRHMHHAERAQARANTAEIAAIDAEIRKLLEAQKRCKRNRDTSGALAVARELRNWFGLKAKAEAIVSARVETTAELPLRDALAIAKSLIESQLDDAEVRAWLCELAERIAPVATTEAREIGKVPDGQE